MSPNPAPTLEEILDAFVPDDYWEKIKLKKDHPWVFDIIRVLHKLSHPLISEEQKDC